MPRLCMLTDNSTRFRSDNGIGNHRSQETDVLGPFGMPEAPKIDPTNDGSRIERWLGPDTGSEGKIISI